MKKPMKLLFCIVLLLTSLLPLTGYLFNVKTTIPGIQQPSSPSIVKNNEVNVSFFDELDDAFSTSFPFRSTMISIYHRLTEGIFKQSGSSQVLVGKDGYLFFEETLDDYLNLSQLSENDLIRFNRTMQLQSDAMARLGIASYFMVVPNKASIYGERMPAHLKPVGETNLLEQLRKMDLAMDFIDVKDALIQAKEETGLPIYHARDSHWNAIGAAIGYEFMMAELGQTSLHLIGQTPVRSKDWLGDLSIMLYPDKSDYDIQYTYNLPEAFTFTRAVRTFEDMEFESINPTKEGHLFLFRDSFANALVPYLSDSFARVNYSRVFPYDYREVKTMDIDTLVIEIAERNLNRLLQVTPVLVSEPHASSTIAPFSQKTAVQMTSSKVNSLFYMNARFTDQDFGRKITNIKIIVDETEYDAFPIYQDADFEDDLIEYGFSLYTQTKLDEDEIWILGQIDGDWYRLN